MDDSRSVSQKIPRAKRTGRKIVKQPKPNHHTAKKQALRRKIKHSPQYRRNDFLPHRLHRSQEHKWTYSEENVKEDYSGLLTYKPVMTEDQEIIQKLNMLRF